MPATDAKTIERIRDASRRLVRELGFMESTLAGTELSPSGVHAIVEIGRRESVNAQALATTLRLEKSTVSRLLKALIADGYVSDERDSRDTRQKRLRLTGKGQETLAAISRYADQQVRAAVADLEPRAIETIAAGLKTYAAALGKGVAATVPDNPAATIEIVEDYRPGVVGETVAMHAAYYSRAAGFGAAFEAKVASEMADFMGRMDHDLNQIWTATMSDQLVGTISIDGQDLGSDTAHLRWFIVADQVRGKGVGRRLIKAAMHFVDQGGLAQTRLWTFSGLDAARRLYEDHGFELVDQKPGGQWGKTVQEQEFVRRRKACS